MSISSAIAGASGSLAASASRALALPAGAASQRAGASEGAAGPVAGVLKAQEAAQAAKERDADRLDAGQLKKTLDEVNKVLAGFSISVQFAIDPDNQDLLVRVMDQASGKLIRQIPSEDVVRMAKVMDNLKGMLFSEKA